MKEVALVLGSGGARGLAHIGAIEALEANNYHITSIAGCSMGSIIAGMFAAGKLKEAREWFLKVDIQTILRLTDVSITGNSLVKGSKVIRALQQIVPDCQIEDLQIPLTLVASDLLSSEEVIFDHGSLFDAIRASMSIPLFFKPVNDGKHLLVDGGLLNPLPLNRVHRKQGDMLIAVNVSGRDKINKRSVNALKMADRITDLQIERNSELTIALTQPDVVVTMPHYTFGTFDFNRAEEIINAGYNMMNLALMAIS